MTDQADRLREEISIVSGDKQRYGEILKSIETSLQAGNSINIEDLRYFKNVSENTESNRVHEVVLNNNNCLK